MMNACTHVHTFNVEFVWKFCQRLKKRALGRTQKYGSSYFLEYLIKY